MSIAQTLRFDSKTSPGSITVRNKDTNEILAFIVKIHKNSGHARAIPVGDWITVCVDQNKRVINAVRSVAHGPYKEVKAQLIKVFS